MGLSFRPYVNLRVILNIAFFAAWLAMPARIAAATPIAKAPSSASTAESEKPDTRRLSGRVLAPDGQPVHRANVEIYADYGNRAHVVASREDGTYDADALPDTNLNIALFHPTYGQQFFPGITLGQEKVDFQFGKGSRNQIDHPAALAARYGKNDPEIQFQIRVIDWLTSRAVSNFKVARAPGLRIEVDPAVPGEFRATGGRVGGVYEFRIEAPGYAVFESGAIVGRQAQPVVREMFKLGVGGSIIGRVVSADTKTPIAGVTVAAEQDNVTRENVRVTRHIYPGDNYGDGQVSVTGTDGRFELKGIAEGHKRVDFTPAGAALVPISRPVHVLYDRISDLGDIEIGAGATIVGRILRSPGDMPWSGVAVSLKHRGLRSVTAAEGSFEFRALQNGIHMLQLPDDGTEAWVGLDAGERKEVTLRVGSVSVIGTVTRGGRAEPASIRASRLGVDHNMIRFTTTDDTGKFTLKNCSPGSWQIHVTAKENSTWTFQKFVEIPESGPPVEKQFAIPSAKLAVNVAGPSNNPAAAVRVFARRTAESGAAIHPDASTVETDDAGRAVFDGLQPGIYTITVDGGEIGRSERTGLAITDGESTQVALILAPPVPGGTIVSTALNLATGQPVRTAWCHLIRTDGSLFEHARERNDRGVITIPNIPPGSYRVQVSALGFSIAQHEVAIRDSGTTQIEDVLYSAGALRWALKDSSGKPAVGVYCRLTPTDPKSIETTREGVTDAHGMFICRGLLPGVYTGTAASHPTNSPVTIKVSIAASNVTDEVSRVD